MEQIDLQLQQVLYRIRLASPDPGLWRGSAASTLQSALSQLESEIIALSFELGLGP
jgi:hypothetical protein